MVGDTGQMRYIFIVTESSRRTRGLFILQVDLGSIQVFHVACMDPHIG